MSIATPLWSQIPYTPLPAGETAEAMAPRNIQVLIEKGASGALLEVRGPYYLFNPHDGSRISAGLLGKRFMVHELEQGLKWGEEFPGIHQFYVQPRSPETTIFVNGIQYSGSIAIYGVDNTVHIVNDLPIESYVKGVLSTQFTAPLEPEVLSSLAILARTNAYYYATQQSPRFWHLSAGDSGFSGTGLVISGSPIDKAVDSTRHLILVHPTGGKELPFATTWTEHSAGRTAPYNVLFRKEGLAPEQGVEAPHALFAREHSKWHYTLSRKKLAELFALSGIDSIEPFRDATSQKVYGLRLRNGNAIHDVDFLTFQAKVGAHHLLSSEFSFSLQEGTVQFDGFGRGHGVGLCLYSASALAQNGENAVRILSKFFPNTYLYNLGALVTQTEEPAPPQE